MANPLVGHRIALKELGKQKGVCLSVWCGVVCLSVWRQNFSHLDTWPGLAWWPVSELAIRPKQRNSANLSSKLLMLFL